MSAISLAYEETTVLQQTSCFSGFYKSPQPASSVSSDPVRWGCTVDVSTRVGLTFAGSRILAVS